MERQDFLKSATAASLAAAGPVGLSQSQQTSASPSKNSPIARPENPAMIYRELGTTGERVSAIGMGGFLRTRALARRMQFGSSARLLTAASHFSTIAGTITRVSLRFVLAER
jgi:hypothetical protein